MSIHLVVGDLFHADRQKIRRTDEHDEDNSRCL
jgi:hypothetical protein